MTPCEPISSSFWRWSLSKRHPSLPRPFLRGGRVWFPTGESRKLTNNNGYWTCRWHGKAYRVHRLVMEHKEGRNLRADEDVHHLNGNRHDNRPSNLFVLSRSSHNHLTHCLHPLFHLCPECNRVFADHPHRRGRARLYCSNGCRARAWGVWAGQRVRELRAQTGLQARITRARYWQLQAQVRRSSRPPAEILRVSSTTPAPLSSVRRTRTGPLAPHENTAGK